MARRRLGTLWGRIHRDPFTHSLLRYCRKFSTFKSFIAGPPVQFGAGQLAKHAHRSVVGSSGGTVVTTSVCVDDGKPLLTVDCRLRHHGAGIIPGNWNRVEGMPQREEILVARAVDRSLRPLVDDHRYHVSCSLQSFGQGNAVSLAINTAAAALNLDMAASSVGVSPNGDIHQDVNTDEDMLGELIYVGSKRGEVIMMEWSSYAEPLPEERMLELMDVAQETLRPVRDTMDEFAILQEKVLADRTDATAETPKSLDSDLASIVQQCQGILQDELAQLFQMDEFRSGTRSSGVTVHSGSLPSKSARGQLEGEVVEKIRSTVGDILNKLSKDESIEVDRISEQVRLQLLQSAMHQALTNGLRADNRGPTALRPICVQVPALPEQIHGSALFERGDTQVLCTATLGPPRDGRPYRSLLKPRSVRKTATTEFSDSLPVGSLRFLRTQESLMSDHNSTLVTADNSHLNVHNETQKCWLQYDFPEYSTGSVPTGKSTLRRSTGHGALAEKAIQAVLPSTLPYSIRLTSEVTDSNGSSSMATVSGATLALLDAGVPLTAPVCGVSVGGTVHDHPGLMLDITGTEDHYGVMDFKIAGTSDGVTAFQLDVKRPLSQSTVAEALMLARDGRREMLADMGNQMESMNGFKGLRPRAELKHSAPHVEIIRYDAQRKRDLVGPGGIILRQLEERYQVSLDLSQEGQCLLFGENDAVKQAKSAIMDLVADVVPGEVYTGTVIEIKDYGAIVELLRNKEGILHVSELAAGNEELIREHSDGAMGFVSNALSEGQSIEVLCTDVDRVNGSIRLSLPKTTCFQ